MNRSIEVLRRTSMAISVGVRSETFLYPSFDVISDQFGGVKGLPKIPRYTARTADYGGKIAVLWDRDVASTAVIALERRSDEEIWGKLEWKEPVLEVPKSCRIIRALAATL
ncbi:hypothetical protein F2Q70_00034071 [Brassica cretica]|uniref:Uncharacterized protein n=2 Tax=Brassica TaxID=3705 RepID=A0A8S9JU85_BRACR|nr:hypothetical protein F2Q70_00034071 [Brassica cretica]